MKRHAFKQTELTREAECGVKLHRLDGKKRRQASFCEKDLNETICSFHLCLRIVRDWRDGICSLYLECWIYPG